MFDHAILHTVLPPHLGLYSLMCVARVSRAWWRALHAQWYRQHHQRRRWRQLRASLPARGGRIRVREIYLDPDLSQNARRVLDALLTWSPEIKKSMAEADVCAHLAHHFGRWTLLQRWVAAAWGRNDSPPPRVRRALATWDGKEAWDFNACETEGWKLARYAEMSAMDTHVEWWAFCRVWPRHPAARSFRLPAAARTRALEAACAACMTAEQRAMLGCANRLLQLEGLPSR